MTFPFYEHPGIGRTRDLSVAELSRMSLFGDKATDAVTVCVAGKKGKWLFVEWDESGDGGWVAMARSWRYEPWALFLPGKTVRMLPGLQKSYYLLREQPLKSRDERPNVKQSDRLVVDRVEDDWILVKVGGEPAGWLRWRDDNGRFLIRVDAAGNFP